MRGSLLILFPAILVNLGWQHPGAWLNALLLCLLLGQELRIPDEDSLQPDAPHPAKKFVRGGLRGLYLINAGLLWCHDLMPVALAAVVRTQGKMKLRALGVSLECLIEVPKRWVQPVEAYQRIPCDDQARRIEEEEAHLLEVEREGTERLGDGDEGARLE